MQHTHRLLFCLLIASAGSSVVVPSAAQDPKTKAESGSSDRGTADDRKEVASKHYQRGVTFYADGDFKLALVEFRRAYELTRNYRVLYNIGQVNQQLNNYSKALAALEQYLAEGGDTIPASRRDAVNNDIAQLRSKIAQLDIVVDIEQAEVLVDGEVVGKSPLPGPVRLDAGDHRIEARRDGYRGTSTSVTLATRDNAKVELHLTEPKPLASRPVPAASFRADRLPTVIVEHRTSPWLWAGWISSGAFAAGAVVTGLLAMNEANNLATLRNSPTSTAAQRDSAQGSAQALAITTDVLAATAFVVGATSLYFSLRHDKPTHRGAAAPKISLGPTSVFFSGEF